MLQYWTNESRVKLSSNTSSHKLQEEFLSDVCLNRWRWLAHQSTGERWGPVWAEMHQVCQRSEQEVWVVLHWFPLRWVFALTFRRRLETVCRHRRLSGCLGMLCECLGWCMHGCMRGKCFSGFIAQAIQKSSVLWQCAGWLTNARTVSQIKTWYLTCSDGLE